MLDIGFWELVLVAVIALIVLGPERLPVAARTAGRLVARVRRQLRELTGELDGDDSISELKRELSRLREQIEDDTDVDHIKSQLSQTRDEIKGEADALSEIAEHDFDHDFDHDDDETSTRHARPPAGADDDHDSNVAVLESRDTQHVAAGEDAYVDNHADPAASELPDDLADDAASWADAARHVHGEQVPSAANTQTAANHYPQQDTAE